MFISANTLPALPGFSKSVADQRKLNQYRFDHQQPALQRFRESARQNRNQTVEYIFRGDYEEQFFNDARVQNNFNQQVHPANQRAIFNYIDAQTASVQRPERQGQLLDIFI